MIKNTENSFFFIRSRIAIISGKGIFAKYATKKASFCSSSHMIILYHIFIIVSVCGKQKKRRWRMQKKQLKHISSNSAPQGSRAVFVESSNKTSEHKGRRLHKSGKVRTGAKLNHPEGGNPLILI